MSKLTLSSNLAKPDDVYQTIINAHNGLDDEESMRLNAKLILILTNHIGDPEIITEAIAAAKGS